MFRKILKLFGFVLGFFLGACPFSILIAYGPPPVDYRRYILNGNVRNTAGLPLNNININFHNSVTNSDSNGEWEMITLSYPCTECELVVEDKDGADNGGEYVNKTVILDLEQTEETNIDYSGTFEQHNIEIELEEK